MELNLSTQTASMNSAQQGGEQCVQWTVDTPCAVQPGGAGIGIGIGIIAACIRSIHYVHYTYIEPLGFGVCHSICQIAYK